MDGRRLQELRDVYTKLSHQSTGPTAVGSGLDQGRGSTLDTSTAAPAAAAAEEAPVALSPPPPPPPPPEAAAAAAAAAAATGVDTLGKRGSLQRAGAAGEVGTGGDTASAVSSSTSQLKVEESGSWPGSAGGELLPMSSLATTASASAIAAAGSSSARPASSSRGSVARIFSRTDNNNSSSSTNNSSNTNNANTNTNTNTNISLLQKDGLLGQQTLDALMAGSPLGGGSASLRSTRAELKREMTAATEELERGLGWDAKRRRKTKHVERNSFYPSSYFEWTEELMAKKLSERATGSFAAAIFELGLKHSSPKVLMKLMPPKAERLTTEHIKSRLQKYRLHAHRSKDEFLDFFNLRLKDKYREFLKKEAWRNSPVQQGSAGSPDDGEYDSGGGEDGGGGGAASTASGGEGSAAGDPVPKAGLEVKVDGQAVGDIHELGAQCIREQVHLQEIMRHHISAQLKLQAEIHEHLGTGSTDSPAAAGGAGAGGAGAGGGGEGTRPRSSSDSGGVLKG